jgi:prepilin-type N-terminal cleavage/methylation domain-containing protein/prepilin-type processing-associated H-X9-DG protein
MKLSTTHPTSRKGFTLIELLVVIAIIAILASILFPVFARARENARRSSCLSNMKQIGLGIKQYQQDYDEMFPPRKNLGATLPVDQYGGWPILIQPYVKSEQIFQCPSEPNAPGGMTSGTAVDYFYNYSLGSKDNGSGGEIQGGVSEASLPFVTSTVMNGDAHTKVSTNTSFDITYSPEDITASKRHLEGANYAFADGHAKWLRPEKIGGGYWGDTTRCGSSGTNTPNGSNATLCIN